MPRPHRRAAVGLLPLRLHGKTRTPSLRNRPAVSGCAAGDRWKIGDNRVMRSVGTLGIFRLHLLPAARLLLTVANHTEHAPWPENQSRTRRNTKPSSAKGCP